jgi:hypothetical protein
MARPQDVEGEPFNVKKNKPVTKMNKHLEKRTSTKYPVHRV